MWKLNKIRSVIGLIVFVVLIIIALLFIQHKNNQLKSNLETGESQSSVIRWSFNSDGNSAVTENDGITENESLHNSLKTYAPDYQAYYMKRIGDECAVCRSDLMLQADGVYSMNNTLATHVSRRPTTVYETFYGYYPITGLGWQIIQRAGIGLAPTLTSKDEPRYVSEDGSVIITSTGKCIGAEFPQAINDILTDNVSIGSVVECGESVCIFFDDAVRSIAVWNIKDNIIRTAVLPCYANAPVVSPTGDYIVFCSVNSNTNNIGSSQCSVYALKLGDLTCEPVTNKAVSNRYDFLGDSNTLVFSAYPENAKVTLNSAVLYKTDLDNLADGTVEITLSEASGPVTPFTSANGEYIAVVCSDDGEKGMLKIYNTENNTCENLDSNVMLLEASGKLEGKNIFFYTRIGNGGTKQLIACNMDTRLRYLVDEIDASMNATITISNLYIIDVNDNETAEATEDN